MHAGNADGAWRLNGLTSLAFRGNHMDRGIVVGPISRVVSSKFDSSTATAYGELTYDLDMAGWTLQPMAAPISRPNRMHASASWPCRWGCAANGEHGNPKQMAPLRPTC